MVNARLRETLCASTCSGLFSNCFGDGQGLHSRTMKETEKRVTVIPTSRANGRAAVDLGREPSWYPVSVYGAAAGRQSRKHLGHDRADLSYVDGAISPLIRRPVTCLGQARGCFGGTRRSRMAFRPIGLGMSKEK